MNKAAFLHIVRQVAPIQDQEVDDLERLVVSFPYCQTAHVLLAKAAHDRGSMLSTQKLRRAAAHVSNRQLLKQLVYAAPAVEEIAAPVAEEEFEKETSAPYVSEPVLENEPQNEFTEELLEEEELAEVTSAEDLMEPEAAIEPVLVEEPQNTYADQDVQAPFEENSLETEVLAEAPAPEENHTFAEIAPENLPLNVPEFSSSEEVKEEAVENFVEPEVEVISEEVPPEASVESLEGTALIEESDATEEESEADASFSEEDDNLDELLELIQINSLTSFSAPIPSVNLSHEEIISELTSAPEAELTDEPAIDFGKVAERLSGQSPAEAETEEVGLSAYLEIAKLDTLYDTSGYEFPTLKLPEVVQGTSSADDAAQDPYLSIFTQNNLAYWMGSSRLGESIQLKDDLTTTTPFFFQPELIIEHVKEQNAPAPAPEVSPAAKLDQQMDIINQFLKTTPKRKTLANAQLNNEPQEDLSAKSSKIKKTLVSENLALIFIKQGKGRKAIKIYEQLIVKFPEKKSYFAEQIDKLRNE